MARSSGIPERDWRTTLRAIQRGDVIPVIGPELLVLGGDDGNVTLHDHLAAELVERLGIDRTELDDRSSLVAVASHYLTREGGTRPDLCDEITDILEGRTWPTPEPLRQLAAIRHFNLFVTTTFDPLMEQALNAVRFAGSDRAVSRKYSLRRPHSDVSPDGGATENEPVVFHLFGQPDTLHDYAVTEDDVLQFSHNLQAADKRPENLFELLHSRSLLMLGWNFPGWLTRFFMCAAAGPRMFDPDTPLGVIADDESRRDRTLTMFLGRRDLTMYQTEGGAVKFVEELHERWTDKFEGGIGDGKRSDVPPAQASARQRRSRFVFISYAREDLAQASKIRDRLDSAGIEVWFDQTRLESGTKYEDEIRSRIEDCEFFLPVISRSTNQEESFFLKEWNWAISRTEGQSKSRRFIVPVVVDDTSEQADYLPPEFKAVHIERADDGALPAEFVDSTKKYIRNKERMEQGLLAKT